MNEGLVTIKLTTGAPYVAPDFPLLRQTPGMNGKWGRFRFVWNTPVSRCDAWFVYDGLPVEDATMCPPENVVFITAEPQSYRTYPRRWTKQFAHVITSQRGLSHRSVLRSHTGLPWFLNKAYDQLNASGANNKTKALSIICSKKRNMKWHRVRLKFLEGLKSEFGDQIDFYGRGFRNLPDKWDGLQPYRFSIALENCLETDYFSEKLTDCFLAETVPIYCGCPNISDYFPEDSLVRINIQDEPGTHAALRRILAAATQEYDHRRVDLMEAKKRALERFNLFNLVGDFCSRLDFSLPPEKVTLRPEPPVGPLAKPIIKFKRAYIGPEWPIPWAKA